MEFLNINLQKDSLPERAGRALSFAALLPVLPQKLTVYPNLVDVGADSCSISQDQFLVCAIGVNKLVYNYFLRKNIDDVAP